MDSLIIFSDKCHRKISYPNSCSEPSIPIERWADMHSLIIYDERNEGSVLIPYQVHKVFSSGNLVKVTKGDYCLTGRLISSDPDRGNVTVRKDDRSIVEIRNYDMLESKSFDDDYSLSVSDCQGTLHVSYISSLIYWSGSYTAILDTNSISMLRYTAYIHNRTGKSLSSCKVSLRNPSYSLGIVSLEEETIVDVFTLSMIPFSFHDSEIDVILTWRTPQFLPSGPLYIYTSGKHLAGSFIGQISMQETEEMSTITWKIPKHSLMTDKNSFFSMSHPETPQPSENSPDTEHLDTPSKHDSM